MWYFGCDTRSTTAGSHILLARCVPDARTLDWDRWTCARPSLYELREQRLRVMPGITNPEHSLFTDLGVSREALTSFSLSASSRGPGGCCTLGPADTEPWLTIGTDPSILWRGEARRQLQVGPGQGGLALAICVQVRQRPGGVVAALTAWSGSQLIHRAERPFPQPASPLRFRCWTKPEGPVWSLDHLLFLPAFESPTRESS